MFFCINLVHNNNNDNNSNNNSNNNNIYLVNFFHILCFLIKTEIATNLSFKVFKTAVNLSLN